MRTCEQRSLWQTAMDAATGVAVLHFGTLTVEVKVRPLSTEAAMQAGLLFAQLQQMVSAARTHDPEDETALDAADREAAAQDTTPEELIGQTVAWLRSALPVAVAHATHVKDLDSGEWVPLTWCETVEEAQAVEAGGGAALPSGLLTQPDVNSIIVAGLRPAQEVAGLLRPFRAAGAAV